MGLKLRRKLIAFATILLTGFSGITAVSPAASAANTPVGGRFCPSGYFGWNSFSDLRDNLDQRYPRDGRIWRVPSDNEVWELWCTATHSQASMKTTQGQEPVVKPSTVFLDDGTRLDFRTASKSGGYTIDINNNVNSKIFKIHVA